MAISSRKRKLHAVGTHSLGVVLPPLFLERKGLTKSCEVIVEDLLDTVLIKVVPKAGEEEEIEF